MPKPPMIGGSGDDKGLIETELLEKGRSVARLGADDYDRRVGRAAPVGA